MTTPAAVETEAQIFKKLIYRRIPNLGGISMKLSMSQCGVDFFNVCGTIPSHRVQGRGRKNAEGFPFMSLARTLASLEAGKCLHSR